MQAERALAERHNSMMSCTYHASVKVLCVGVLLLLVGCGTEAIKVSDGNLVDKVERQWLIGDQSKARAVFSPEDEKVTLSVNFDYNLRAAYEWYRVEWIDPNGKPYKVVSTRTEFGSHRALQANIKIRGKMAARLPGLWRVRLFHLDEAGNKERLLFARLFRIARADKPETPVVASPPPAAGAPVAADQAISLSTPLDAETGFSEAILTVERAGKATEQAPKGAAGRSYPGCPPMYYPPDEGCIEEAPEE